MTRSDLYTLLGQAVRFYPEPTDGIHKQLQTFAVVRSLSDLNSETLDRGLIDRSKPYFYSRAWEARGYTERIQYDFPALLAIDRVARYDRPFHTQDRAVCPLMQISALYPNVEHLESGLSDRCKLMAVEEIYDLTEQMIRYAVEYIKAGVYATTDVDPDPAWYNQSYLDWLVGEGTITSYTILDAETHSFQKYLQRENPQVTVSYHDDISMHMLCGTSVEIRVCSTECGSGIAPTFADPVDCCGKEIVQ